MSCSLRRLVEPWLGVATVGKGIHALIAVAMDWQVQKVLPAYFATLVLWLRSDILLVMQLPRL